MPVSAPPTSGEIHQAATRTFDSRLLFAIVWAFAQMVTWVRPGPALLVGGDSGIYARIARELAERPLSKWWFVTLEGQGFYEHPPLGLWLEALMFRCFGPSVESAVAWAHVCAALTITLVGITAWELATRRARMVDGLDGPAAGAFAILGLLALPGFQYQSQVAMFEMPLMVMLSLGLWATASLEVSRAPEGDHFPRAAVVTWAVALCAGFWVKGPPIFVLVGVVLVLAALKRIRVWVAIAPLALGAVFIVISTQAFDAWCARHQVPRFFDTWLAIQVLPSITEGHHNPDPNPLFYVRPAAQWYWPIVASLPVAAAVLAVRRRRVWAWRLLPEMVGLGGLTWLGVIIGFSLMRQKYPWYVHLGAPGAALATGAVFALFPARFERHLATTLLVATLGWTIVRWLPWAPTRAASEILAVQKTPPPTGADLRVSDCSQQEAWAATHLMGFVWRAQREPCDAHTPWRWDGVALTAQP